MEYERNLESDQFFVSKSRIKEAGNGLYSKKCFKKGEIIGEYTGKTFWLTDDQFLKQFKDSDIYLMGLSYKNPKTKKSKYLDGNPIYKESGLLSFANDAVNTEFENNAEFIESGSKVFMTALKRISKGDEILVDYGKEYWN